MKFFKNEKLNKERGSATIEAIISFTGFLFVIFTILNVVNFCRAQMLISNAVDTATKEITQYSYFYKMSGLQKFSEDISNNAEDGKTNLNDVLGTVDGLYSSIGTAVDNTTQHATNVQDAVEEGNFNLTEIQNTLASIKSDGTNIETSMNSVMSAFDSVQDNPLLYMKSIIAVAGNESLDMLKSHVIAAPLAKSFTAKHFGKTTAEANDFLKGLGVVDGLDGMNFKMSTIFSSDSPEDVHIVVYYRLKIVQIFGWATLEVPMCKESVARAWLGGDDVQKVVEPMVPAAEPEDTETPEGEGTETEENEEQKEEETPEKVDTTNSYWHLGDGGYGVENAGRDQAFMDLYNQTYNIDTSKPGWYQQQKGTDGSYSGNLYYQDCALDSSYNEFDAAFYLGELHRIQDQINDGTLPYSTKSFTYVVYVPENISDAEYNKMKENIAKGQTDYQFMMSGADEETKKQYADIGMSVQIVKAGGNYDYGSEG